MDSLPFPFARCKTTEAWLHGSVPKQSEDVQSNQRKTISACLVPSTNPSSEQLEAPALLPAVGSGSAGVASCPSWG